MMVGGDAERSSRSSRCSRDIGPKVTRVGDNGLAVSMKIAHQPEPDVQMLAYSEGVLMAEKGGIDREDGGRSADQQRDRLADGAVPRSVRARACRMRPGSTAR